MAYQIEFEDVGQDLIRLEVDEETGEITDAGIHSDIYADGRHHVIVADLKTDRTVRFRRQNQPEIFSFRYLMAKLSLNGRVLCDAG